MEIPNDARGEVEIEIAGTKFILVPSFQNVKKIETALGYSLIRLLNKVSIEKDISFSEAILIIGVASKDNKLNEDEIGNLIMEQGIYSVSLSIIKFIGPILTGKKGNQPAKGSN